LIPHDDFETKRLLQYLLKEVSTDPKNKHQLLMSISSLHKEILNQKTVNRGDAFKTISSLNLMEINQILFSTYKKISSDQSAYVRRIALISL